MINRKLALFCLFFFKKLLHNLKEVDILDHVLERAVK